jgi:hypothetical protein
MGTPPGASNDANAGGQPPIVARSAAPMKPGRTIGGDHTTPSGLPRNAARDVPRGIFTLRCTILARASPC